jgi:hypothetical protein
MRAGDLLGLESITFVAGGGFVSVLGFFDVNLTVVEERDLLSA